MIAFRFPDTITSKLTTKSLLKSKDFRSHLKMLNTLLHKYSHTPWLSFLLYYFHGITSLNLSEIISVMNELKDEILNSLYKITNMLVYFE